MDEIGLDIVTLPDTSSWPRNRWRTFLASSIFPLLTSHRGDSGKKNNVNIKKKREGIARTPSITLQLGEALNDITKTIQYDKNIPPEPLNWGSVFNDPLISEGAVSDI